MTFYENYPQIPWAIISDERKTASTSDFSLRSFYCPFATASRH
jgi:hypothetical protein